MRFLADENFPLASVKRLREAGHDVLAIIQVDKYASAHCPKEQRELSI